MGARADTISIHKPAETRVSDSARALFLRWRPVVFDLILRKLGNVEEAENLAQDALMRALSRHAQGTVDRFGPYVMRTATNLAIDRLRRRRFEGEVADVELALVATDEAGAVEHVRLREAVEALPGPLREVIELRYEQELSFAEIGRALGLSKNAVFARHGKALDALRASFSERRT